MENFSLSFSNMDHSLYVLMITLGKQSNHITNEKLDQEFTVTFALIFSARSVCSLLSIMMLRNRIVNLNSIS